MAKIGKHALNDPFKGRRYEKWLAKKTEWEKANKRKLLGRYRNGNYVVSLLSDGTKIRETVDPDATKFEADFPENIDIKVSNKCDMGCAYCHEASTSTGEVAKLMPLHPFFKTLRPWTELALGGGNLFECEDILPFLWELKLRKIIPNITVNQKHFKTLLPLIQTLAKEKLIYGIGVSLTNPSQDFRGIIKKFHNAVIHVINGIVTVNDLKKLSYNGSKILILGYKNFRRGKDYYKKGSEEIEKNKADLKQHLPEIFKKSWFDVVSFDNLAIEQLNVRSLLSKEKWEEFYMGDDGQHTMYIDLVKQEYAKNSTSTERFPLTDNIVDMFQKVRSL